MTDKLETYRAGRGPARRLPIASGRFTARGWRTWAWMASPSTRRCPAVGPNELLVRHDACGLCFSDIKVIRLGQQHPRITKDMTVDPVVLGHEVSVTVVEVGEKLRGPVQAGRPLHHPGGDLQERRQPGVRLHAARRAVRVRARSTDTILERRRRQLPDPGPAGHGLRRERADRAVGVRHRGVRAEVPRAASSRAAALWIIGGPAVEDRLYTIGCGFDAESHPRGRVPDQRPAHVRHLARAHARPNSASRSS